MKRSLELYHCGKFLLPLPLPLQLARARRINIAVWMPRLGLLTLFMSVGMTIRMGSSNH